MLVSDTTPTKQKIPSSTERDLERAQAEGDFSNKSLTITYFHTGCSTIIGAKSFHGPVRDGKGWDRLAMVIRHDLSTIREEVKVGGVFSNTGKCYITVKVIGTSLTGN